MSQILVFPKSKPYGPTSTNSRQAIKPDAQFPTEVIDYLKIDIYDSQSEDNNPYNYVGGNGRSRNKGFGGSIKQEIYLYLPNQLAESYSARYNLQALGEVGSGAVGLAGDMIGAGGISDDFGSKVESMAKAAKPQLGFALGAQAISTIASATGGSASLTPNSLSALTQKKIFNPYEEMVFEGVDPRQHSFNFTLAPKTASDVVTINEIIQSLRKAMLPAYGTGAGSENRWLTIPDYFRLSIVRHKSSGEQEEIVSPNSGDKGGVLQNLMRFPVKCVLGGMQLNLAQGGNYASLQSRAGGDETYDFGPVAYQMQLTFKETGLLVRDFFEDSNV